MLSVIAFIIVLSVSVIAIYKLVNQPYYWLSGTVKNDAVSVDIES